MDKRVYTGPSFKEWAAKNQKEIKEKVESA